VLLLVLVLLVLLFDVTVLVLFDVLLVSTRLLVSYVP
jgi:hypothetical protein